MLITTDMSYFIEVNMRLVRFRISHIVNLQGFNVYIYVCLDRICFQSRDKHHYGHILQVTDGNHYLLDCD
jgi:hypothetical protein